MRLNGFSKLVSMQLSVAFVCLFAQFHVTEAKDVSWGSMKANRILFLGNSITMHSPKPSIGWNNNCGMAASAPAKDYVHVLTTAINSRTGGTLRVEPTDPAIVNPADGSILPGHVNSANAINICHNFEWGYTTYNNSMFQPQIDSKPDIVVLQFGENVDAGTLDTTVLKASLQTLVTGLKNSSNPNIFFPSLILGANPTIDAIKQQVIAEDPSHRVFVDMSSVSQDLANLGGWGHPNDKGMALIANKLSSAMDAHATAAPEPGSITLLAAGMIVLFVHVLRKHNSSRVTP